MAERPEIFLKPLLQERMVQIKNFEFVKIHHGMFLNPSLLYATSSGKIVGYTIGNDAQEVLR